MHVWGNVIIFLNKLCLESVLEFWYERNEKKKKLKRHVFNNVVFFSHIGYLSKHFGDLVPKKLKNTQKTRFW